MVPVLIMLITSLFAYSPISPPRQAERFVGAEACKDCHTEIHQAWSTTKHAQALNKLSESDRAGGRCIGCHVTDTKEMLQAAGGDPKFPNVQCEACHGAGRAHVEAARADNATAARTAPIGEATCTRCHNPESPTYKPFIFSAMSGLAHSVR